MAATPTPTHTPSSSRFSRLAQWCFEHRWLTLLTWIAGLAVTAALGFGVVGNRNSTDFRLPGTDSQRAYDLLKEHFPVQNGQTDQVVFHALGGGKLSDAQNRRAISDVMAKIAKLPAVGEAASPVAKGGQLSQDGTIGVGAVTYKRGLDKLETDDIKSVQKVAKTARSSTLQVEFGGAGAQFLRQSEAGGSSEGFGILAAFIVLIITFGAFVAALIPLLTALLAIGGATALIALMSHIVDTPEFATQLAALIGLGVGVDYALLVVTRYRAEVAEGVSRHDAIAIAVDTAGRTVFFAAITVIIALLGLLLLGLNFMQGVAVGAAAAVLLTMIGALTLLPAFASIFRNAIDGHLLRKGLTKFSLPTGWLPTLRRSTGRIDLDHGPWARWSRFVQRRPWQVAVVALALLAVLISPVFGLRLGSSDAGVDPQESTTRKAYDLIAQGFGPGVNGSFLIVADLKQKGDEQAAQQVAAVAKTDGDLFAVTPPRLSPDGAIATITAFPKTGPQDEKTTKTLNTLRDDVLPKAEQQTGANVLVGGFTASQEDFSDAVAGKLLLFIGVVVVLSALLLLAVFRSVLIPLKAAAMNLLSIGAALGIVTAIFQNGTFAGVIGIETGPIESFFPVLLFAIVFGLSMDYEVFLLSRVHEEWERGHDASGAVARGLSATGRVITAAAAIMVVVFAGFALGDDRIIKLFGIGLAAAVLIDALVIRCLLVPAIMEILGRRAWWLPAWLDRAVPRIALEHSESAPPAPVETRA